MILFNLENELSEISFYIKYKYHEFCKKIMIRGNFDVKKIETQEKSEMEQLEDLIIKSGAVGSLMIFRNKDKDKEEELFFEEL